MPQILPLKISSHSTLKASSERSISEVSSCMLLFLLCARHTSPPATSAPATPKPHKKQKHHRQQSQVEQTPTPHMTSTQMSTPGRPDAREATPSVSTIKAENDSKPAGARVSLQPLSATVGFLLSFLSMLLHYYHFYELSYTAATINWLNSSGGNLLLSHTEIIYLHMTVMLEIGVSRKQAK